MILLDLLRKPFWLVILSLSAYALDPLPTQEKAHPIAVSAPIELTVESMGLPPSDFPLTSKAWGGTDRETIEDIFLTFPTTYPADTLRELARQFLIAAMVVPPSKKSLSHANFLVMRAEKLTEMGDPNAALDLLNVHRSVSQKPLSLRLRFEKNLLQGNVIEACTLAEKNLKELGGVYWEKAQISCQILQGKSAQVNLSLAAFTESYGAIEKNFIKIANLALNPELMPQAEKFDHLDIQGFALLNLIAQPDVLTGLIPLQIPFDLVLNSPTASPISKLTLAEKKGGILLQEAYDQYYQAHQVDLVKLVPIVDPDQNSLELRALLFYQSMHAPVDVERYKALEMLLSNAKKNGLYWKITEALQPMLSELKPEAGAAYLSDLVLPAIVAAGDSACDWKNHISPEDHVVSIPLLLMGCRTIDPKLIDQFFESWLKSLEAYPPEVGLTYGENVLSLISATGVPVPAKIWNHFRHQRPRKNTLFSQAQRMLLVDALMHKRQAEALGYLLILAGQMKDDLINIENMRLILLGLENLGLHKFAVKTAVEWLSILSLPKKSEV